MKALGPEKWSKIFSVGGDVLGSIGKGIKPEDELPVTEKGLFNRQDEQQIAQLESQLGEQEKKNKQTMYIAIGVIAVVLLFGKKLMK
jgi:hypothetical protein